MSYSLLSLLLCLLIPLLLFLFPIRRDSTMFSLESLFEHSCLSWLAREAAEKSQEPTRYGLKQVHRDPSGIRATGQIEFEYVGAPRSLCVIHLPHTNTAPVLLLFMAWA